MNGQFWIGRKAVRPDHDPARGFGNLRPSRKHFGLTPREREIISVILEGFSNSDIAARFSISEKTVKHHLTNIFDKVGVSNRLELALFALHHRITPVSTPAPGPGPS